MCLLLTHPATTAFDFDDITDFYSKNPDGIGAMWASNNVLYHKKALPKNAGKAWDFYNDYVVGKDAVMHFRMTTHGDTNHDNAHPFEVFGDGSPHPLFMAHNGILSTGNAKDKARSDTYHYIQDYLKPILADSPALIFEPAFKSLLGQAIGTGNKFIFMDYRGEISIINEAQFVTYKGAKLSNTYAWSAYKGGYGGRTGWFNDDNYTNYTLPSPAQIYLPPTSTSHVLTDKELVRDFFIMLKSLGFQQAYNALTYNVVKVALNGCLADDWDDFRDEIGSYYMTDADIIEIVKERKVADYVRGRFFPSDMTKNYISEEK